MQIDKELINKCIQYYANFKIDKKINLFGNFQYKLLNSNEYNAWMENLANLYILAFSMWETKNYQEIIGLLLVEKLDKLVVKKFEEKLEEGKGNCSCSCSWNLMNTTILSKIEEILKDEKC